MQLKKTIIRLIRSMLWTWSIDKDARRTNNNTLYTCSSCLVTIDCGRLICYFVYIYFTTVEVQGEETEYVLKQFPSLVCLFVCLYFS